MGYIFYIMGKSSSGKDTIFRKLNENGELGLKNIVSYTTRPIRKGEEEGREYHFVGLDSFERLNEQGQVIEYRGYNTIHGMWYYFLADDGQINLEKDSYLLIGTLEGYKSLIKYFSKEDIVPIYLEVPDGVRLQRALVREMAQPSPKYAELCRRYLADEEDFSEQKLNEENIKNRFKNDDANETYKLIADYIRRYMDGYKN